MKETRLMLILEFGSINKAWDAKFNNVREFTYDERLVIIEWATGWE